MKSRLYGVDHMANITMPSQIIPTPLWRTLVLSVGFVAVVIACAVSCSSLGAVTSPGALDSAEYLSVDGAELYLHVRGADSRAPVMLWLHGGPGGAERPLFRYYNSEIENHFVVVYWDQRGAGRSFSDQANPSLLTVARHLADLDSVVDHLMRTLRRDRVVLVGHSWGSALGMLYARAHPEKVSAFVGVNQIVSMREAHVAEYTFLKKEAARRGDEKMLRRLEAIGAPPFDSAKEAFAVEELVKEYGGLFHQEPNRFWVAFCGIFRGLVTPWEIPRFIRANNVSLEAMHDELLKLDLARDVPALDVPVLFFLGRYDRHTDSEIASTYFGHLKAPLKRLIWFDESAHNIPFEEADRFNTTLVRELQALGILQR
ncbi:MAG: alpha/beta hydrolase [candidate division KSB1 bacterium]|nr:alpha/beta hydrolase [candidate division KSB1 bacterium]MDZ7276208.1 alpha/beta hydrolase [candidate division KSB1 bacterium]MDZ7287012.1 alpha/beta hydrolase [candidate division KSB1 bacterium]MDZ7297063.1 alpha/beta hydrolase [candidate division KSB1 bacterium]MDZ7307176.1 alpha/beta hydrolase [candidate division KSB1 bacterium]